MKTDRICSHYGDFAPTHRICSHHKDFSFVYAMILDLGYTITMDVITSMAV